MARFSGATWRGPVENRYAGGMARPILGVVLHIMEGTLDGTDGWFRNPASQASAHFGTGRDGRIYQWVDTDDASWAQGAGNRRYVSIENEGYATDHLTDAQLRTVASIVAWLATTENVALTLAETPGDRGLGWHGMGGTAWGGHVGCPGDLIKAQRPAILSAVTQRLNPQPVAHGEEDDVLSFTDATGHYRCEADGAVYAFKPDGSPGGRYLGGLNNHPQWQAGAGTANGPPFIFGPTPQGGYVITTRDAGGQFHPYVFPPDGSLAK